MESALQYDLISFNDRIAIGAFYFRILAVEQDLGIQNIVCKAVDKTDGEVILSLFTDKIEVGISAANCGERLASDPRKFTCQNG